MAKVHWVSNETPDRFGQGGQRRQFFQIRALEQAGHVVRVVTLAGPQDDASVGEIAHDVHRVPKLELRGRLPIPWRRHAVSRRLARWGDVIVVAHGESWERFAWALPEGVPTVVDLHNVFSRWSGTSAESERWLDLERRIRASADLVTVTSEREAGAVPEGDAPVLVVENGIDPQEWSVEPAPAATPVVKLFGNWSWAPNAAGLSWFAREVWPAVHEATGARCEIAGGGVDPVVASASGIVAPGRVGDLQAFLSDAWALAIPLPKSVGAPVKYAEALAVGVPVISTDQGAPGHRDLPAVTDDPEVWITTLSNWLGHAAAPPHLDTTDRQARLTRLSWTNATVFLEKWITAQAMRSTGRDSERSIMSAGGDSGAKTWRHR